MENTGLLVERFSGRELLHRLVAEGQLELAFQDVAEDRTGMTVRLAGFSRLVGHLDHRDAGFLPVQGLDDVRAEIVVTFPEPCSR